MFSQLGPLFKTQFRQTESNDTRQYIPHEERDKFRRKQDDTKKKSDDDAWTDDASVSVMALKAFLINFLNSRSDQNNANEKISPAEAESFSTRPKEKKRPTSTYNAKAVRAYQTMATHATHDKTAIKQDMEDIKNSGSDADQLVSEEVREVHQMIDDLDKLERRGVENLHILNATSFVDSLKNAIQKELQKFKT